ncbi:alpha-parvin [Exaiptasia diaphana]|uniref:Calponin-homology (CH) domain-containing protein n=1 Tax=Exaiptasia diaphana TaxID=2652724 RepID=A0A913WQX3_EXADI|nr:alpha-parvin [Exaiptasia diaphana]XP_020911265.1 alpha-parvin [Exaiptasia diaphana]
MATSPRTPTTPATPSSPTGTLKRDNSKKDAGVFGWMGTLSRRKKGETEVNQLENEGKFAIESPTTPIHMIPPDTYDMEEGEVRSMIEPGSLEDPKVHQLKVVLLEWLNEVLADKRIVVRDVEEDLYDGLILSHLMEKLADIVLQEFKEVNQTVEVQQAKLSVLLNEINKTIRVPQHRAKWTTEKVHSKDTVAILHLLVSLAKHYNCRQKLTPDVKINTMVVQKKNGMLIPQRVVEEITGPDADMMDGKPERDAFDALFDNAPEKLGVVKKSLQGFVNRHLNKLNLEVTNIDTQFHDGVYFIFLLGLLEGFFVPLYQFHVTPANEDQKRQNVELALDLMRDSGLKFHAKTEDIMKRDLKSTLRIVYSLFQKYKHLK